MAATHGIGMRGRRRPWRGPALATAALSLSVLLPSSLTPTVEAIPSAGSSLEDCTVLGTEGDDYLVATDPEGDVVCGLGGDDVLVSGPGDDELRGGPGRDTVDYRRAVSGVRVDLQAGTAVGHGNDVLHSIENVRGSRHDDTLIGNRKANVLMGGPGDDVLVGGGGRDTLDGGRGRDTLDLSRSPKGVVVDLKAGRARGEGRYRLRRIENVIGSRFDDILYGNGRPNILWGRGGADILDGRGGNDRLYGGRGPDTLLGGRGRDLLAGGPGFDSCLQGHRRGGVKRSCEGRALGSAAGVTLFLPARKPVGVTFHESLFAPAAPMRPHGRLRINDNPRKFRPPPPSDGPPYVVMSSRGRPTGATTASDFVVRRSTPIRSPVTGRVVRVRNYRLYCAHPDTQIFIRPDGHPHIRVAIFHVRDVRVRRGDRVLASVTKLARAREFPGRAQEDHYFPGPYPHVHLEIERGRAMPVPGCR